MACSAYNSFHFVLVEMAKRGIRIRNTEDRKRVLIKMPLVLKAHLFFRIKTNFSFEKYFFFFSSQKSNFPGYYNLLPWTIEG